MKKENEHKVDKKEYFKENSYTFLIKLFSVFTIWSLYVGITEFDYYGVKFLIIPAFLLLGIWLIFYFGNDAYKKYLKSTE